VSDLSTGVARVETRAEFVAEVRRLGKTLVPLITAVAPGEGIVP
jgi:hypothetical protein